MLAMPMLPLPLSRPHSLSFSIREITGAWDRRRFVRFAGRLYRGDRYWSPGIISERSNALDPKNPALARLQLGLFVAESRTLDEIVGTVAVWVDSRGDATRSAPRTGCFGLFEAVNEGDVISSLLGTAETWVQEHLPGAGGLRGPMDPDPCRSPGLLVDGYNHKPAILMPYNPPYYAELIEQAGYEPGAELLAYQLDLSALRDPLSLEVVRLQAEARAVEARRGLVIREIGGEPDWRTILPQAEHGLADATWRLSPDSPAVTFSEVLLHLRRIAGRQPPAITLAACTGEDGGAVALGVAAPNIRQSALAALGKRLTNRRPAGKQSVVPMGMASRRARKAGIRLMPAIVRTDCLAWGLEASIRTELLIRATQQGHAVAEVSPMPFGDLMARDDLAALGARPYKTYAIYEKKF